MFKNEMMQHISQKVCVKSLDQHIGKEHSLQNKKAWVPGLPEPPSYKKVSYLE